MTRVAYLKRIVAGAMEDVADGRVPPTSLPCSPGIRC